MSRRGAMHLRASRGITRFGSPMLTETAEPQFQAWATDLPDPSEDRIMLAIQYATAIVAALAAGLLSLVS